MIEVILGGMDPETANTTQVPPPFLAVEPQHDIAMALNLHLQGTLEWLQWTSPTTSAPTSQYSMPRRKLPSVTLGAPPSARTEDPLSPEGMELPVPDPMATSSQASLGEVMSEHIPSTVEVSHSPSPPAVSKTLDVASISPSPQSWAPPGLIQLTWPMRCFDCQGRWMQPWSGCSWPRPTWTPVKGSWCRMLTLPHAKMRPWLPRPSKRQKSAMWLPLGRQRPTVKLQSRRQKPAILPSLHLGKIPWGKYT